LTIVLSLAIGIGANTAIFTLVDAALLKPLPVSDPDSLRVIEWTNGGFPEGIRNVNGDYRPIGGGRVQASSVSANAYRQLARDQTTFEALVGAADPSPVAIAVDSVPAEQVSVQHVSSNFFQGLGVAPALGRPFRPDEDAVGTEPVVILSHRFWLHRFGGNGNVLDRMVRINNTPARIVGVAPPRFFGLRAGEWVDIYAPLAARVAFRLQTDTNHRSEDDGDWWVRQMGRLKRGVSETAARTQIAGIFRGLAVPEGVTIEPRKIPELITLPGRRGFNAVNPRDANALWILMLLVCVLLFMVCANVANLLLSRSVVRERESTVRIALGAGRSRLFRQHLIESGVFALLGGAVGIALGYTLAQAIHRLIESGRDASSGFDLHPDMRVLGYTAAMSMLTAILFGLAPAIASTRSGLNGTLKAQSRSIMANRGTFWARLPRALVSIQIALCLTTLVAAGLLGRSLGNLKLVDIGFDREHLAYATVTPGQAGYQGDRMAQYVERVRQELGRLPGVLGVSPVQVRPLSGNGNVSSAFLPGKSYHVEKGAVSAAEGVNRNMVGDGFFETVRIPLLMGRAFNRDDMRSGSDAAVVDEMFARRYFPGEDPIGRRFGTKVTETTRYRIIGVVGTSRYNSLHSDMRPVVYEPWVPREMRYAIHFAIRTSMDSGRLSEAVRKAVASVDPAVPLTEFHTQAALIDRLLRTERLLGFLSGAFSLLALSLATIGLGGLLAYAVARRTSEIGLRMALGATGEDVIRMVLRDSVLMVGAGIAIGLPCAWATARLLKTALFGLDPLDLQAAGFSLLVLIVGALIAGCVPAYRAANIDPMSALREE
jgi:predicted permease